MEPLSQALASAVSEGGGRFLFFAALAALSAYALGCFNGALLISRYILRDDVRNHGSANAGLTNFYRTFGPRWSLAVVAVDAGKMVAALQVGLLLLHASDSPLRPFVLYWCGIFCVLGHMFPVTEKFRGGKGVFSSGILTLFLDWRIALGVWALFCLLFFLTRLVSLSAMTAVAGLVPATGLVYRDPVLVGMAFCLTVLVIAAHHENLRRLLAGQEPKFHFHREKARRNT